MNTFGCTCELYLNIILFLDTQLLKTKETQHASETGTYAKWSSCPCTKQNLLLNYKTTWRLVLQKQ